MDLSELRASLLEALGVSVSEEPNEEVGEPATTKVVITALRELIDPLTDWLHATDTGRSV